MSNRRGSRGRADDASRLARDFAREALQADVATRYYIDGLTLKEIAQERGCSVSTVSRLLTRAQADQVVEVHVRYPVAVSPALQAELVRTFGLRVARVARTVSNDPFHLAPQVVDLAARYVSTLLTDDAIVCLAWGTAVRGVVNAVTPGQHRGLQIVQGLGSLGSRLPTIDNPLLIQILADRVGGTPHYLPAPTIVASTSVRDALARDPHFSETLGLIRRADIALIGIGPIEPARSGLCRAGYLDSWDLERFRAAGAVGDIMVEFYDLDGTLMETDVTPRVMGMRRDDLRNTRAVIAVAGGTAKAPAILGALRTGLIHVLVTDDDTARKVLELARVHPAPATAPAASQEMTLPMLSESHSDQAARRAVLQATISLLARDGFGRLSLDAVSSTAAVERYAIVREWKSKSDLVLDAFASLPGQEQPSWGDLPYGLEQFLTSLFVGHPESVDSVTRAHRNLVAESIHDPALHRLYLGLQQTWRTMLAKAIEHAVTLGDQQIGSDPDTMADLLLGPVLYRLHVTQASIDPAFIRDVVAAAVDSARALNAGS